jgi:NAD(P)-dependent dehydrogenase (short-subunit alcohol dehydrogenase family)
MWVELGEASAPEAVVELLRRKLQEHVSATGFPPKMVLVAGLGLFSAGDDWIGAVTAAKVYIDIVKVMAGAARLGGIHHMPDRERKFIEGWEVEAYRKNIAAGKTKAGKVAGKVAFVTGAAQGFGLEIARDFAAQAAHVVLADVNLEGARGAAEEIAAKAGRGRAIAIEIDVTSPASVEAAFHQVVRTFGGLDLLVSNAGVLRAQSVKTQSERDFEFVTDVNYKGYFLCVRAAAPILALQHLTKPDYMSDIIQINSKSGLVGSNRNFAYAGSKFGGIGLTQSFAMELISDGIKVNAICPGNFFDGPLWSDPTSGLFVQYLRTGKVPGAKTIADVRRAYEAKVPLGRGCQAADVMKAIYYVIEQKYETGQAVPVTGGQVMLS